MDDLESIGVNLNRTSKAYNNARGKLVSGRSNLIGRAEKLHDLGVSPKKSLPTRDATVANDVEGVPRLGGAEQWRRRGRCCFPEPFLSEPYGKSDAATARLQSGKPPVFCVIGCL